MFLQAMVLVQSWRFLLTINVTGNLQKFGIEIIPVLEGGNVEKEAYVEDGVHINSSWLDGLGKQEAIDKMVAWLEEHKCGQKKVSYKLRDWLFSRQRYWENQFQLFIWKMGQ